MRLAASLIMAGLDGFQLDEVTEKLVKHFGIRAFILFKRNVVDQEQLHRLIADLKALIIEAGLTPLIAVDQEGGPVRRLEPPGFSDIPGNSETGSELVPETAVAQQARKTATLLAPLGININFAPVLDLALSASRGVLKGRCFGADPAKVSRLGKIYIEELQASGVAAVAKHFPGIGRVEIDPHHHRPVVDADRDIVMDEMVPFRTAVSAGVAGIMTSHVVFNRLDPALPVTFSPFVAKDLLRNQLGFQGVLFSDDMEMGGITGKDHPATAAVAALHAGHDMVLICSDQKLAMETVTSIAMALEQGELAVQALETSFDRIEELAARFSGSPC